MLKIVPPVNLTNQAKVKCGEIFCYSSADFTIFCTLCDMKSFALDDFLLHVQNLHFENTLQTPKSANKQYNQYLEMNIKNESNTNLKDLLWEQSYDDADVISNYDDSDSSFCDEPTMTIMSLKNTTSSRWDSTHNIKSNKSNIFSSCLVSNPLPSDDAGTQKQASTKMLKIQMNAKKRAEVTKKKYKEIDEHPCPECEQIFLHLKYLDRHVFELHNGYKCSLCEKRFRLRHHLRRHIQIHTAERKFTCPIEECGKGFTDEEYLKRHLEVHTMKRTFMCDFENCGKAFQTQRRLTIHTYTHRKSKKLVCDICGYSCRANITLKIHQRVHTGEKPFGCEICKKRFVSKTALTEHMISHSNTRPHVCKICNSSFANQRVLQRHSFIHSDEKTFKCKLCDSAFKQANGLDGHIRRMHRAPKITSISVPLKGL